MMKGKEKSMIEAVPIETTPVTREEKLHRFLQTIQEKVVGMIDTNMLKISKQKVPFDTSNKEPLKIAERLKRVKQSRERMQSQLQYMTIEERQLKMRQKSLQKVDATVKQSKLLNWHLREKSQLSQEDISVLRKLKNEHREFERSLDRKTQAFELMLLNSKKEEEELFKQQRQEQCEAKRQQIRKKLEENQQLRAAKMRQYEQQKRKLLEIKTKKKLFEEMEKAQKETDKVTIEKKMALMQERMREKEVDMEAVREHEQKYREMKAERRMERDRKQEEYQTIARQRRGQLQAFQKSKYYTINVEQTRRQKQQFREKQRERQQLVQAARLYAQVVKRDHVPKVLGNTLPDLSPKPKMQSLSCEQIKQVGNHYMQQMRLNLKKRNIKNSSKLSNGVSEGSMTDGSASTKYKDYLTERRRLRVDKQQKMSRTDDSRIRDRTIRRDLNEVHKIMSSGDNKIQKLQKIRNIASKLQVQRNGEDFNMLDKISAKLQILQTLTSS